MLDDSETVAARIADADEAITEQAPAAPRLVTTSEAAHIVVESHDEIAASAPHDVPVLRVAAVSGTPVSSAPIAAVPVTAAESPVQPAAALPLQSAAAAPAAVDESLRDVSDDVDKQVLPIFLEEAAELFPQAGEQLRAWRKKPADIDAGARACRRTLHTFKGSARMAGAMRLGELAHLMESRLPEGEAIARPRAGAVRRARHRPRSHRLRARPTARGRGQQRAAVAADRGRGGGRRRRPAASRGQAARSPRCPLAATRTAGPATAHRPRPRPRARARKLRVRADLIDRLVNEAGEVAIARARVEGELRSLKAQPARADQAA